jgi:hypothetical protein
LSFYFFASLIVLLFREQVGQANPSQFSFSFSIFFYPTLIFFVRSFFCKSIFLSQSHVTSGKLVEFTWVDSDFFSSIFMCVFFQFHRFAFYYLPLSFIILSLFLFGYFKSRLVKLTRVSLFFFMFFYWTLVFLPSLSFEILYLSLSHLAGCGFVKLARVTQFFFIFNIRLIGLELYDFFSLSFLCGVSVLYPRSHFSKFNLICLKLSSPEYHFLALRNLGLARSIARAIYLVNIF